MTLLDLDDGEALVEGDRDTVAVGVGHVRLVGGAVSIGLDALDGSAGDGRFGCGGGLGGDVTGEGFLALAAA